MKKTSFLVDRDKAIEACAKVCEAEGMAGMDTYIAGLCAKAIRQLTLEECMEQDSFAWDGTAQGVEIMSREIDRQRAEIESLSAQVAKSEQQHESDKNWLRAQRDVAEEKLRDMTKERDEYKGCVELGIDDAASDMADFSAMRIRAEAAEAQVAELRKDAERYRWLRSEEVATDPRWYPFWDEFNVKLCRENKMDKLIDAAKESGNE
jgi:hypothetical protein